MVWSLTFNILNRFTFLVIFSPDVRESKTVLDSGFHTVDSGFQYLSLELGFWIPVVSGILDSLSCIPDSKDQDSGFHKQKFLGFWILQAKISQIPESGFPYTGRIFDLPFQLRQLIRCQRFITLFIPIFHYSTFQGYPSLQDYS